MIDSHSHILSEFYDNIDELINTFISKNVINVINCADDENTSLEVVDLYKKSNGYLIPIVGIHPENINESINQLEIIEDLIQNNKVFGVGEIGLDYNYNSENKNIQKQYFKQQLLLAEKYNLPVVVHSRDSIQDCLDIVKSSEAKGIIHCFSGSYEMAKEFIKQGYYIGIGGVLTFKNSNLYKVVEKLELENIVIETDSPFLSPEPLRGKKNIPPNVYYVAKKISEIKNIDIEAVINVTTGNVKKIFDF